MQLQAAYVNRKTKYALRLSMESESCNERMMGIFCKIGLKMLDDKNLLLQMIEEGMTVAKVTASIAPEEDVASLLRFIRRANEDYGKIVSVPNYPLALALETSGPDVHIGENEKGSACLFEVEKDETVTLTSDEEYQLKSNNEHLFIRYPDIASVLQPGDKLSLFGGFAVLEVSQIDGGNVVCKALRKGNFPSYSKVTLPQRTITWSTLSPKDKQDIELAVREEVDMIYLAYTRNVETITEARTLMGEAGKNIALIANIEDEEGVNNIDEIIKEVDAVQVSRDSIAANLGSIRAYNVGAEIIRKCQEASKPVIMAGLALCTMSYMDWISSDSEPNDEEECFISSLVLDGADAVGLEDETFSGRYPEVCIKKVVDICKCTDGATWQPELIEKAKKELALAQCPVLNFMYSAVELSRSSVAALIVVANCAWTTAPLLAHFRPRVPIVAVTREPSVARRLQLCKGVFPLHFSEPPCSSWAEELEARSRYGITYGKCRGVIRNGEWVILLRGWRPKLRYANTITLMFAHDKWLNYVLKV